MTRYTVVLSYLDRDGNAALYCEHRSCASAQEAYDVAKRGFEDDGKSVDDALVLDNGMECVVLDRCDLCDTLIGFKVWPPLCKPCEEVAKAHARLEQSKLVGEDEIERYRRLN